VGRKVFLCARWQITTALVHAVDDLARNRAAKEVKGGRTAVRHVTVTRL
jgi:hypothetical protein